MYLGSSGVHDPLKVVKCPEYLSVRDQPDRGTLHVLLEFPGAYLSKIEYIPRLGMYTRFFNNLMRFLWSIGLLRDGQIDWT
jgi:hypothetical protein